MALTLADRGDKLRSETLFLYFIEHFLYSELCTLLILGLFQGSQNRLLNFLSLDTHDIERGQLRCTRNSMFFTVPICSRDNIWNILTSSDRNPANTSNKFALDTYLTFTILHGMLVGWWYYSCHIHSSQWPMGRRIQRQKRTFSIPSRQVYRSGWGDR